MTYNKSNDSITCIICEKAMADENFVKKFNYDNTFFTKYGFKAWKLKGEFINLHLRFKNYPKSHVFTTFWIFLQL